MRKQMIKAAMEQRAKASEESEKKVMTFREHLAAMTSKE